MLPVGHDDLATFDACPAQIRSVWQIPGDAHSEGTAHTGSARSAEISNEAGPSADLSGPTEIGARRMRDQGWTRWADDMPDRRSKIGLRLDATTRARVAARVERIR